MNTVFADTYYYLAVLNPSDEAHMHAREWTAKFRGRIVTTTWVLAEVADGSARSQDRGTVAQFLEGLLTRPNAIVLDPDWNQFRSGLHLYGKRLDKDWSLTDCISFVAMETESLRDVLTGDHHFAQAGFNLLLPRTGVSS